MSLVVSKLLCLLLLPRRPLPAGEMKNYSLVSSLSFISKLVEHVVAKQLSEHVHVHDLDNPYQSAYKTGHSIDTTILSIKMKFTYHCQEVILQPCYCSTSLLPLTPLIIPFFLVVFRLSLELGALFLNGSLSN